MRLLIDIIVALMLAGILAGVVMHNRQTQSTTDQRDMARAEVRRFQQQIHYQVVMAQGEHSEHGYPESIDPAWFQGNLPENPLLTAEHPWVEVAASSRRGAEHPTSLVATDRSAARFWYNPHNGIVRARVPAGISDAQALELYNYVNECRLVSLFTGQ